MKLNTKIRKLDAFSIFLLSLVDYFRKIRTMLAFLDAKMDRPRSSFPRQCIILVCSDRELDITLNIDNTEK